MDTDIWLPLATLVLGWGLAQVTEKLKDRRASNRDRLARHAELQRTTLLELQDALMDLWLGILGDLESEMGLGFDDQGPWKHVAEATRTMPATRSRVKLLAHRVEDECVRELLAALVKASMELEAKLVAEDFRGAAQALKEVRANQREAVARIGELLRQRY